MKLKHILGTVTIVVIVGGAIYAIKRSKDLEKVEGEAITAEEARAMVEQMKKGRSNQEFEELLEDLEPIDVDAVREEAHDIASWNHSFNEPNYDGEEIESPLIEEDTEVLNRPLKEYMTEEDMVLRHEPSSREARQQFIKMELAEWAPLEDTYQLMVNLFDFPFNPENDGDHDLKTTIIDFRVQFFGFGSRWAKEVSYADVILHYARAAQYNCNETVRYWVEYFLDFSEFDLETPSRRVDDLLKRLNTHTYFNEERATFGLFGLTRQSMEQAIKIANRNIDRSVTYEIEFNEFLKQCL